MSPKLLVVIFLLFSFHKLQGQEPITIGHKSQLYSQVLGEDREYYVYLPPSYDHTEYGKNNYPVIYLLDGEMYFSTLVAIQQMYTKGLYNSMPECILIGIVNTNRTRDLTPSKSFLMKNGKKHFEDSGGASSFTQFIEKELKRQINDTYRTSGFDILIGHSFGGLYVADIFSKTDSDYNAYLCIDASLWWNDGEVYNLFSEAIEKGEKMSPLYFAFSSSDVKEADKQKHQFYLKQASGLINNQNSTIIQSESFPSENHGTVVLPAIYQGLRKIFDGIQLPVLDVLNNPQIIQERYELLSQKFNIKLFPDPQSLYKLARYAKSVKNDEVANYICLYALEIYGEAPAFRKLQESLEL